VQRLTEVLDDEKNRILSRNFREFETISSEKQKLFECLVSGSPPDREMLENLRKKARRNQELIATTITAIRSVRGRISALSN
ncbi:hypothetical protein, partial [Escherichia coli]|uniref:hypothetical protein n=1 Tax=Escherichia coli TaxID=562 RepID=UPI001AA1077C